jgi:hypothetical protein
MVRSEEIFEEYRRRWIEFQNKVINRYRAFVVKAFQKLKEPARVAVVR